MNCDPLQPYQAPPSWTADHVMMRMTWAFDYLRRFPLKCLPDGYGSGWPEFVRDHADINSQMTNMEGETDDQRDARIAADQRFEYARQKIPLNMYEVSAMDEAFLWPIRYLGGDKAECVQIVRWAYQQSRGMRTTEIDMQAVLREASTIAWHLIQRGVVVR
jgi:hypothetical protein